jgi:hypothetical protein
MANTLDILRERIRESGTTAVSDALAYQVLDYCQKMVNARLGIVVDSASHNWPASTTYQVIKDIESDVMTNVLAITQSTRTIWHEPNWRNFSYYDPEWWTQVGTRFEAWSQIGHNILVIYPQIAAQTTVTIYYAKKTTTLDDAADDLDITAVSGIDLMYDFAEILLHVHLRNFTEARERIKALSVSLQSGFPRVNNDYSEPMMTADDSIKNKYHQFSELPGA